MPRGDKKTDARILVRKRRALVPRNIALLISPGGPGEFVQQFHFCTTQSVDTRESGIKLNYSNAIIMAVE